MRCNHLVDFISEPFFANVLILTRAQRVNVITPFFESTLIGFESFLQFIRSASPHSNLTDQQWFDEFTYLANLPTFFAIAE